MGHTNSAIKVIGVGGGGSNAVDRMIQVGIAGVDFITANTDFQALSLSEAPCKIQLGPTSTRGLGTGGDVTLGCNAAEESRDSIEEALSGAEIVFLAAALGGGTGSGAAALVAEVGQSLGALIIAVVTRPFAFEGSRRIAAAQQALEALKERANAVIAISNDRLVQLMDASTSLDIAFRIADDVLRQGVQGVAELLTSPGLVRLDLAHVSALMGTAGGVVMSVGQGHGEDKALDAAEMAIISPLTDIRCVTGAKGLLINVTGGDDLSLEEVQQAVKVVAQAAQLDANIHFGAVIDPKMTGRVQVTVIAVGLSEDQPQSVEPLQILVDPRNPTWSVNSIKRPEPISYEPFVTETDLDIPAFIRRRRSRFWLEEERCR